MFNLLHPAEKVKAIEILEHCKEIMPKHNFLCHCINAIEAYKLFGMQGNFVIKQIRGEIKERLMGYDTYLTMLWEMGQISEETFCNASIEERDALRCQWIEEMIADLKGEASA